MWGGWESVGVGRVGVCEYVEDGSLWVWGGWESVSMWRVGVCGRGEGRSIHDLHLKKFLGS